MLSQIDKLIAGYLREVEILETHFSHPVSSKITSLTIFLLVILVLYKAITSVWNYLSGKLQPAVSGHHDGKQGPKGAAEASDDYAKKPVHCAHLYIEANVVLDPPANLLLKSPLKYHIEFSPEDFEDCHDPELGSTLGFTRKKLYHLFKDSSIYKEMRHDIDTFRVSDVKIFYNSGELKPADDATQLCLLGIETGFLLDVLFSITKK